MSPAVITVSPCRWWSAVEEGAQVPHRMKGVTIVDERFVAKAHALDLQVHVWTIDDADEMHELLDLGVDGIMTDRPSVLRQVLTDRGCWY